MVAPPPAPDYGISTNGGGGPQGRAILLLVDQGNIRFGSARPVMQNALKFLERLQPNDRVGLVAIPGPGELVDFTTDRGKLREAMLRVAGRVTPQPRRFNISVTEAFAIYRRSDATLITQVIARECAGVFGAADVERCERDVEQEASEIIGDQRQQTDRSVAAIRSVLQSLGALEGQKSVILISEGLVLETLGAELDDLAGIAADVRASLDVLLLDVALFDASQAQRPTTAADDRRLQEEGLMMLAGMARGTLHRVVSSADTAFRRIEQSLAGYYLLGVEPGTNDRDGRRHKIEVTTARKGVSLQARRAFLSPEGPPAASPADALKRTLRSPTPATALPIRASTWTYKEPGTSRVRLVVAAEVERATDDPLQYATGLVIATKEGKVVAASEDARDLTPIVGDETRATYAGVITVDPGTYRMRVALADAEKRAGSLEREVQAWQLNGDTLTLGDLLVAPEPPAGGAVSPQVEPRIHNGMLVALAEAYTPPTAQNAEVTARLDILRDESSRPIASSPLQVIVGASPEMRVAQGRVSVSAVPPGAYLARVSFTEAGAARGALIRPFRVLPPRPAGDGALPTGSGAPADLMAAILASLPGRDERRRARRRHHGGALDGRRTRTHGPRARRHQDRARRAVDRWRARSPRRRGSGCGVLRARHGPAREVTDRSGGHAVPDGHAHPGRLFGRARHAGRVPAHSQSREGSGRAADERAARHGAGLRAARRRSVAEGGPALGRGDVARTADRRTGWRYPRDA